MDSPRWNRCRAAMRAGSLASLLLAPASLARAEDPGWDFASGSGSALQSTCVVGQSALGSSVNVQVANPGAVPQAVVVVVHASVGGTSLVGSATTVVMPGQSSTVSVPFPGTVQSIQSVSLGA